MVIKNNNMKYAAISSRGIGDQVFFMITVPTAIPERFADDVNEMFDRKAKEFLEELKKYVKKHGGR